MKTRDDSSNSTSPTLTTVLFSSPSHSPTHSLTSLTRQPQHHGTLATRHPAARTAHQHLLCPTRRPPTTTPPRRSWRRRRLLPPHLARHRRRAALHAPRTGRRIRGQRQLWVPRRRHTGRPLALLWPVTVAIAPFAHPHLLPNRNVAHGHVLAARGTRAGRRRAGPRPRGAAHRRHVWRHQRRRHGHVWRARRRRARRPLRQPARGGQRRGRGQRRGQRGGGGQPRCCHRARGRRALAQGSVYPAALFPADVCALPARDPRGYTPPTAACCAAPQQRGTAAVPLAVGRPPGEHG